MKCRLFNVLAGVSLVLCVVTLARWPRSIKFADAAWFQTKNGIVGYGMNARGYFILGVGRTDITNDWWDWKPGLFVHSFDQRQFPFMPQKGGTVYSHLGLVAVIDSGPKFKMDRGFESFDDGNPVVHALYLPLWFLALFFAVAAMGFTSRGRKSRRRLLAAKGFCWKCGYDLRATPGRCPECGTIPAIKI